MIIRHHWSATICVTIFHPSNTARLTKNTAVILCILLDNEGHLMGPILIDFIWGILFRIKDCLLTQKITYPWLKLVTFGIIVMMFKSLGMSLTISISSIQLQKKLYTQKVPPGDPFPLFIFYLSYFSDWYDSVSSWILCLLISILFSLF